MPHVNRANKIKKIENNYSLTHERKEIAIKSIIVQRDLIWIRDLMKTLIIGVTHQIQSTFFRNTGGPDVKFNWKFEILSLTDYSRLAQLVKER